MAASVDQKVSDRQLVSREEERQVLPGGPDLSALPDIAAAMLAFEEAWKKNRKKNKKKRRKKKTAKKKREIESNVRNDSEQHHQKLGLMPLAIQELVILSDDSDDEVMKRSQRCKMDANDTMHSMEGKELESNTEEGERGNNNIADVGIADHKERNGGTSKVVADHKVSNGHTSKADEYQMLADLTNFPGLASMLTFEAMWKKNRKKKNKKGKKRKIEVGEQSDMEQYPQKPEQMTAIEAPKLQELAILPNSNVNGDMHNGQSCKTNREETTEVKVGKKKKDNGEEEEKHDNVVVQSADNKLITGHIANEDGYKMLMDLTDFQLATMLAFESTWTQNRKKIKKKKRKSALKGLNKLDAAAKEDTQKNTCKDVETTKLLKDDDNVSSVMVIDLDSSSSEVEEVVTDIGSFKSLREMVPGHTSVKRKDNNVKAHPDTVDTVEEDKMSRSSKERMHFNSMDDILPKKLLSRPRYFHHPESSRGTGDYHTSISHSMQTKDENLKICLRCGYHGHDLFSCNSNYSTDDLKKIQCFDCKAYGHFCCADYMVEEPRSVSLCDVRGVVKNNLVQGKTE